MCVCVCEGERLSLWCVVFSIECSLSCVCEKEREREKGREEKRRSAQRVKEGSALAPSKRFSSREKKKKKK